MLTVRPAIAADAQAMADLINPIIAAGGTTAYEDPFDAARMLAEYIDPPQFVSCVVAEEDGQLLGFQGTTRSYDPSDPFPDDWAIIGTFTRIGLTQRGVGAAMFARTMEIARAAGINTIDATIRADNTGGLAFYARLGFVDYARIIGKPLKNGAPMDRIRKRLDL